jgi:putative membrane protein
VIAHSGIDHVFIGVGAAAMIGIYGAAWLRMRRTSVGRLWMWIGGVTLVVVASLPFMETLAQESFSGHMVQHLIVIIGAAPLLVLARPIYTLMAAGWIPTTAFGRRMGVRWHRWAPAIGPGLFIVVMFTTHLTPIYDDALDNRLLHEGEHVAYLVSACAMWASVVGVRRTGAARRVGAVFGVIALSSFLGLILMAATRPLMPTYEARLGFDHAVSDQRSAAAIMWVSGLLTTLPLLIAAVWRWASAEEQMARRAESLADQSARRAAASRN